MMTWRRGHLGIVMVMVAVLAQAMNAQAERLLLCGMDEVFLLKTATAEKGAIEKLWSWRAREHDELSQALRGLFGTTDDCKPVEGGRKILISSSGGACALVDRQSVRVLWYARVPNAHSLELLPRDRVVVASSVNAKGNRLILFNLAQSDQPVWETQLPSAHGVVWDEKRQRLWAPGFAELRCYELKDWESDKPSLELRASHALPDEDGHDLQALPKGTDLVVSTARHVYLFDRERPGFRPHPELGDRRDVKCLSVHPESGRTVFLQGNGEDWWTDTLGFLSPSGQIRLPGERLYKARWLSEPVGK